MAHSRSHRLIGIAIVLLTILAASACVPVTPSAPSGQAPTESATEVAVGTPVPPTAVPATAAFPLTVTDDVGRQVTLESEPERIISLAPSVTEILFAVGAGDQVVGVTSYCDYPPKAATREQIGGFSARTISVEKIVSLAPDLVVAGGSIHQPIIEALDELDITVVALDPNTIEGVYATLELAGRLTGHVEQAKQVVTEMRERVEAIVSTVAEVPEDERPRVYWQIWDEPLMTAGPSTFPGQVLELAGGVNIFGDLTESYPQISAEEVVDRNPEVIMGPDTHGDKLTVEVFEQRPGWSGIEAVQEGEIYLIEGNIVSRAGPRLADALETVAQILYPQRFQ